MRSWERWQRSVTGMSALLAAAVVLQGCNLIGDLSVLELFRKKPQVIKDYDAAKKKYDKQSFAEAAQDFEQFLTAHSDTALTASARYYLGKSYDAQGKQDDAVKNYEAVVKGHSETVWAKSAQKELDRLRPAAEPKAE